MGVFVAGEHKEQVVKMPNCCCCCCCFHHFLILLFPQWQPYMDPPGPCRLVGAMPLDREGVRNYLIQLLVCWTQFCSGSRCGGSLTHMLHPGDFIKPLGRLLTKADIECNTSFLCGTGSIPARKEHVCAWCLTLSKRGTRTWSGRFSRWRSVLSVIARALPFRL